MTGGRGRRGSRPVRYFEADEIPAQLVLDERDVVVEVRPWLVHLGPSIVSVQLTTAARMSGSQPSSA